MKKFLTVVISIAALFLSSCSNGDAEMDLAMLGKVGTTFKVTFDANNGYGNMKKQEFRIGVPDELFSCVFTPPTSEYKFSCWNTKADGTGVDYQQDDKFEIQSSDITLYAKWIPKTSYSIIYKNLYDTTHGNVYSYVVTDTVELSEPSDRIGYAFAGWYESNTFDADSKIEGWNRDEKAGNVTVYAKWDIITYSIVYNLDEGRNSVKNPGTYDYESETITFEAPNKTGYDFLGWYTDAEFNDENKIEKIENNSTGDVELWAKWKIKNYTVTFRNSNNTEQDYTQTFYYHEEKALLGNGFTIPIGYIFKGWSLDNSGNVDFEDFATYKMEDSDIVLYTVWEEKPAHGISYSNILTAANPNPDSYREKDSMTLQDLTLANYKFVGWFLNDEGDAIKTWAPGTYSEDLAFSARWTYPESLTFAGTFPYACGNIPLTYTLTVESLGTVHARKNYSSGDSSQNMNMNLDNIAMKYLADGVVWTATITATNAEHNLYYSSSTSTTVQNYGINLSFPRMVQKR